MYRVKGLEVLILAIGIACFIGHVSCKGFTEKGAIKIINKYRLVHLQDKQYELTEDFTLKQKAMDLVKKAAKGKGFGDDLHAGVNMYQICASFGVALTAKQVVNSWYNEVCQGNVDFTKGTFENAESFSQLVWQDSQRVGIARATGKKGKQTCQYIAAVFRPPGNIESFYTENVKVGKFNKQEYCDNLKRDNIVDV